MTTNATPTTVATPQADARRGVHALDRASGWPAPRFCPAIVAAAPIRPTDVQVISENSSV